MPERDWADFLQRHHRPHLQIVDLGASSDSAAGQRLGASVQRLVESLQSTADYAMCWEGQEIRIAFESDLDATTLRQLLMTRVVKRGLAYGGDSWATTSVCELGPRLTKGRRARRRGTIEIAVAGD
jgi:hypothetical protein